MPFVCKLWLLNIQGHELALLFREAACLFVCLLACLIVCLLVGLFQRCHLFVNSVCSIFMGMRWHYFSERPCTHVRLLWPQCEP